MWVKCTIDGTDYLFDPSYKTWNTTTGIDLASAMGYVQSDYLADAEEGATVTDDYIQNANRTNVRADLATYLRWLARSATRLCLMKSKATCRQNTPPLMAFQIHTRRLYKFIPSAST